MGKMCGTAIGLGLAGALIVLHVYMCMPDREQRHVRRGLTDIVDELHDIADRMSQETNGTKATKTVAFCHFSCYNLE